jgi:hypothetical protein
MTQLDLSKLSTAYHAPVADIHCSLTVADIHRQPPTNTDPDRQGAMVERARVGPTPVPVAQMDVSKFSVAFTELKSPTMVASAQRLSEAFVREDGVKEGTCR